MSGSQNWLQAQADATSPKRVDARKLYDWLGFKAQQCAADQDESAVSLDASVGPSYMAEAFLQVREHMRRFDQSLPFVTAIDNDICM